jgi:hypothetical protein
VPGIAGERDHAHAAAFVTYLLLAFDDIYDVYGSADSVFRRRYAAKGEKFFDTQRYFDDVFVELLPPGRGASFDDYASPALTGLRPMVSG